MSEAAQDVTQAPGLKGQGKKPADALLGLLQPASRNGFAVVTSDQGGEGQKRKRLQQLLLPPTLLLLLLRHREGGRCRRPTTASRRRRRKGPPHLQWGMTPLAAATVSHTAARPPPQPRPAHQHLDKDRQRPHTPRIPASPQL